MRRCPRTVSTVLILCAAVSGLTACSDDTISPPISPEPPTPTSETIGLVEVTISGLGGPGDPSASVLSAATVEELDRLRAERRVTEPGDDPAFTPQALTAPANGDGTIELAPVATGSFTDGERGVDGVRYFWATYRVRNAQTDGTAYDTERTNLTFVAVTDGGTLGGNTPISTLEVYDGSAAAASIADAIVPTGAASRDQNTLEIMSRDADVLQVFTETEAGAITPPAGVTDVFPYGFMVRRADASTTRALPASPAADQYDGVVTFAFRMPLQATASDDPFTVSALFAAYDDSDTRLTQSAEEQRGAAAGRFAAGVAELGATSVSLLPGGTYPGTTTAYLRCSVRATGTSGAPTAAVHKAASTDPWLVTDPWAVTENGPAFLPSTGRIRVGRCGAVWNTPTSANFVVRGLYSGVATGSYVSTGGDEGMIESPAGDFIPGETVETTLTTGLGIGAPIVARYRVASDGGSGTFTVDDQYIVGAGPFSLAAGDFDGDGHLDLAAPAEGAGRVSVLLGNGDGTFPADDTTHAVGTNARHSVAGDFDGDGHLDLATTNYGDDNVSVALGNGDGTFAAAPVQVDSGPRGIATGDFDGDGDLDLATANWDVDRVGVLLGDGNGSFAAAGDYAVGQWPGRVAAGDFDADGDLDLAVANYGGASVSILLGDGDGTFAAAVPYTAGSGAFGIAAGDLDADGDLDLVTANFIDDDVTVLLGNGDGTFDAGVSYAAGEEPWAITMGDFDGDGDLDVAATINADGTVQVFLGHGDGTLASGAPYLVGAQPRGIVAADLDGDGDLDLATADFTDSTVSVLLNH